MDPLNTFPGEEIIGCYRATFSTSKGKEVFIHMMYDLGLFEEVDTPERIALRNYATRLLKILSGGEMSKDNLQNFAMRLMKQQLMKGEDN